jgi:GTP-binding protein
MIPKTADAYDEAPKDAPTRIAVVGKPNVGKSSIVNLMLGDDKQIVTEIPGTTRDSIDSALRYHIRDYDLVDTAGLRRKTNVNYGVEYFSTMRTVEAVDRCDIVVLVLTADEPISQQDVKLASYARRKLKEIMVVFNKWDLVDKDNSSTGKFLADLHEQMPFLQFAPVQFISAKTGQRINRVMETVVKMRMKPRNGFPPQTSTSLWRR